MEIGEKAQLNSVEEWRAWLEQYHQDKADIWLELYKSTSGKRGLTMEQAQEEALCFGWVDGFLKPIDSERYVLRFSPRRKNSNWSQTNRDRAIKLLRAGKIAPAGMALLPPEILRSWEEEQNNTP